MSATVEVSCAWCAETFTARTADRARGWAKCCNKSCAAKFREFGVARSDAPATRRTPNIVRYSQRLGALPSMPLINPSGKKKKKPPKWIRGVLAGAMFQKNNRDQYEDVMDGLSDMDYGASDGGGYESIR